MDMALAQWDAPGLGRASLRPSRSIVNARVSLHAQNLERVRFGGRARQRGRPLSHRNANCRRSVVCQAESQSQGGVTRRVSVPESVDISVDQAKAAVRSAIAAGHNHILLQLLLPLIGPSLLDDWPGGIRQQLKAATPLVTSLLKSLASGSDDGWKKTELSDEDCVMLWETKQALLVLFPTAETLPAIRSIEATRGEGRPLLLVNPQWQGGQVISDFGIGARRQEAEEFLRTFLTAYSLRSTRIASKNVTVVRCFPGDWQVYTADDSAGFQVAGSFPVDPTYKELEALLRKDGGGGKGWFERIASEIEFLKNAK